MELYPNMYEECQEAWSMDACFIFSFGHVLKGVKMKSVKMAMLFIYKLYIIDDSSQNVHIIQFSLGWFLM